MARPSLTGMTHPIATPHAQRRPLHASHPAGLLIATLLLNTAGCSFAGDTGTSAAGAFHFQQSTSKAKTQLAQLVPDGTARNQATRTLSSLGFTCEPTEPSSPEVRASTLCLHATPVSPTDEPRVTPPPTPVNWFITLDSKDGTHVSAIQVARTPADIR